MATSPHQAQPTLLCSEVLRGIEHYQREFYEALLNAILEGTLDGVFLDTPMQLGRAEVQDVLFFDTPAYQTWRQRQETTFEFRRRGLDRAATVTKQEWEDGQVDISAKLAGMRELLRARKKRQHKADGKTRSVSKKAGAELNPRSTAKQQRPKLDSALDGPSEEPGGDQRS